jgi:hypothetical protein
MRAPSRPGGRPRRAAVDLGRIDAAQCSHLRKIVNVADYRAACPIERHLIPDDKLALFEAPPVTRLVGTWQGPGRIIEMRQRPRP